MITIDDDIELIMSKEPPFELFKSSDLYCCIKRTYAGNFNGYVAVPEGHIFYEKKYSDKVFVEDPDATVFNGNYIGLLCANANEFEVGIMSLDMAINVHGGLTYSDKTCWGIEDNILGPLWWFGFDTMHSGDSKPYQTDIDRKYPFLNDGEYRTFEYVKQWCISLAQQLNNLSNKQAIS
jgi:hypothetical protein